MQKIDEESLESFRFVFYVDQIPPGRGTYPNNRYLLTSIYMKDEDADEEGFPKFSDLIDAIDKEIRSNGRYKSCVIFCQKTNWDADYISLADPENCSFFVDKKNWKDFYAEAKKIDFDETALFKTRANPIFYTSEKSRHLTSETKQKSGVSDPKLSTEVLKQLILEKLTTPVIQEKLNTFIKTHKITDFDSNSLANPSVWKRTKKYKQGENTIRNFSCTHPGIKKMGGLDFVAITNNSDTVVVSLSPLFEKSFAQTNNLER